MATRGEETSRPYQLELLEAALEENTIVNLGTGAGKTFIAVMLIKELSPVTFKSWKEQGAKRTFFLVTTVPLVKQQAEYIEKHTSMEVGQYTGSMNVDDWSKEQWDAEFEKNHIFVMTMTIFKNLLLQNVLRFKQVNLLAFDECHHAVKNHDYVQIMRRYSDSCDELDPTRFLGLTASLIPSKCKPGELTKKIEELEKTLHSRAQTARDLSEVAKYATNPEEICISFVPSTYDGDVCKLNAMLEDLLSFLASFPKIQRESEIYKFVKLNFDDYHHILVNLGIWCAHEFACKALKDIADEIEECKGYFKNDIDKMLIHLGHTKMTLFKKESCQLVSGKLGTIHMTDKVRKLLYHLGDMAITSGEIEVSPRSQRNSKVGCVSECREKLRGIVFTERRTTAALLRDLLQKQVLMGAEDMKHIRCDCVVGHNDTSVGTYLRREARMNIKRQEDVLNKFRRGDINLLVSTSVVEEGVDVPMCNAVIRFDFPQNLRSYVQSKGRARAKNSMYVLLIPQDEVGKLRPQLDDYNSLVKELEIVCHDRHVEDDEVILQQLRDMVEPYRNSHGATATIDSSLSTVHKYCQKLPKDSFTVLSPDFKTEKRPIIKGITELNPYRIPGQVEEYQTTLMLPMSSRVSDPIQGQWFPSKRLADKSAALEAVRELDLAGELDERLRPVVRLEDSEDEDEEDDRKREKSRPHAGTEKAHEYYRNKVAPSLHSCLPVCGVEKNYMYMLLITDSITGNMHYSSPEQIGQLTFAIVTSTPLPYKKIPEFSIYEEEKEYNVQMVKYHMNISLDPQELELLKVAHRTLFTHVLCIRPTCLEPAFELAKKNYLVVPVQIILQENMDEQPSSTGLEAFIDLESAQLLVELDRKLSDPNYMYEPVHWPGRSEAFTNAIVVAIHDQQKRLHEVMEVSENVVFSSPFPDLEVAPTYKDYFKEKYKISCSDDQQPALVCKTLGMSSMYLQLLTSRFKQESSKKSDKRGQPIELFPELCRLYPLPANLWKLARCLPSVLWRIESFLTVDGLRLKILQESEIGLCLEDRSELTTCTKVTGYNDLGTRDLKSQKYIPGCGGDDDIMFSSCDSNPIASPLRGPDNGLLLQALTAKSARDSMDLERLETLGDSFLKFSTSVFLYCDRMSAHEGRLSNARSRRVENFNLFFLAKQKDIADFVLTKSFDPRQMWLPPGFHFASSDENTGPSDSESHRTASSLNNDQKNYLYHKLTDKGVADCIESLIGAYLVSGGILAGLKFMEWVGVKITPSKEDETSSPMECAEEGEVLDDSDCYGSPVGNSPPGVNILPQISLTDNDHFTQPPRRKQHKPCPAKVPVVFAKSSEIMRGYFDPDKRLWQPEFKKEDEAVLNRLLCKALAEKKMKDIIGWKFRNRWLLLEALTHASYTRNRLTDSYQRLEFLGDAVLDYLVTCHIYKRFPDYSPGQISCMRSALVNNITFADLAVSLNLQKLLLHSSPSLLKQIDLFLTSKNTEDKEVEVCIEEVSDSLDSSSSSLKLSDDGGEFDEEVEDISPPKVLGDLVESLAGAIFIDSGFSLESVWNIFQPHFDQKIDSFKGRVPLMPIEELLKEVDKISLECEKKGHKKVSYIVSVVRENAPSFRVRARARTKVAAKNAAANRILHRIKKEKL